MSQITLDQFLEVFEQAVELLKPSRFYCKICQKFIENENERLHIQWHIADEMFMARMIARSGFGYGVKGG